MSGKLEGRREVVVVGPCASGKSTLVRGLRAHGFLARVCAQEHSGVPTLWRHRGRPTLIALTADLESVRLRRDSRWPKAVHAQQIMRLADAYAHADAVVPTDGVTSREVLMEALRQLEGIGGEGAVEWPPDSCSPTAAARI